MSLDLQNILASKRALRRELAARRVSEKLRILDALRERELAIRGRAVPPSALREEPAPYVSTAPPPSPHEATLGNVRSKN